MNVGTFLNSVECHLNYLFMPSPYHAAKFHFALKKINFAVRST